jgi:hypothetical protein
MTFGTARDLSSQVVAIAMTPVRDEFKLTRYQRMGVLAGLN